MSKFHNAKLRLHTSVELPKTTGRFEIDVYNEGGNHKRGAISFGQGGIYWKSRKDKKWGRRISWSRLADIFEELR